MSAIPDVRVEQRAWGRHRSVIDFYSTHRGQVGDLYPSEQRFLPVVLRQVGSVLDIGCAAGGFSQIMRSFNPAIAYTGVDVTPAFVEIARRRYPESTFVVGDGIHFSTPECSFDLVHSSGILHVNSQHAAIVSAAYAQARRHLLCDFRLTTGPTVTGTFTVADDGLPTEADVLPYVVLHARDLVDLLMSLRPAPARIELYGYYAAPSPMATLPLAEVLMTMALIEKGDGTRPTELVLDLPPDAARAIEVESRA